MLEFITIGAKYGLCCAVGAAVFASVVALLSPIFMFTLGIVSAILSIGGNKNAGK